MRTRTQQSRDNIIDNSLAKLLEGQDPEVASIIAQKWARDQQVFFEAVKEAQGDKKPEEYSKSNCKHCYGRGYIATLIHDNSKVICRCSTKNYQKWLVEFREDFNTKRDIENATNEQTTPPTGGSQDTQEALTDSAEQS